MSVSEVLAPGLDGLGPVDAERVPVIKALSAILAASIVAPLSLPARATALRAGYAVAALDSVGASPHSPALLAARPTYVEPGETLPAGCDAILPDDAVTENSALIEITRDAAPGAFVRLAGHDLAAGSQLAARGDRLSPAQQWGLRLAGIDSVEILRPRIALNIAPGADRDWLGATLAALGCAVLLPEQTRTPSMLLVHLEIVTTVGSRPAIALNPGETASVLWSTNAAPIIALPHRFDGLIGAFHALVLPVIERLSSQKTPRFIRPLVRKIASSVGVTEVALLKTVAEGYLPLSVGEITLTAWLAADALMLVPPECEGFAVGTEVAAIPLHFQPSVGPA